MVPATWTYREALKIFVDQSEETEFVQEEEEPTEGAPPLPPLSGYKAAFEAAFTVASFAASSARSPACPTVYVFLPAVIHYKNKQDTIDLINAERASSPESLFHYVAIGNGAGIEKFSTVVPDSDSDPDNDEVIVKEVKTLKGMACQTGGVFKQVASDNIIEVVRVALSYYERLAMLKGMGQSDGVVWSETRKVAPDIWGLVVTASAPVFDKSQFPWMLLGVVAADMPVCSLKLAAEAVVSGEGGASMGTGPWWGQNGTNGQRTLQGCQCLGNYSYQFLSKAPRHPAWTTG
jgi:hypothetical protein